ncbi:ParD-like family protein [Asticcacaulis machinosus]|uniref:ParD-like family protein n=1 Tax=Asticcacaulis machinosus TaxID=2984211 RepID=A0ABT5HH14_9CAUL|nr:ParD-like family protein [Asticcacaulis machinosus]MDC7675532.1 ParD-like family protein [Asticcacaulis machinosus]
MGIVNIDDELHEEVRKAGRIMCRSINAQAEFWMKIGMIAESNPSLSFNQIMRQQFAEAGLDAKNYMGTL